MDTKFKMLFLSAVMLISFCLAELAMCDLPTHEKSTEKGIKCKSVMKCPKIELSDTF